MRHPLLEHVHALLLVPRLVNLDAVHLCDVLDEANVLVLEGDPLRVNRSEKSGLEQDVEVVFLPFPESEDCFLLETDLAVGVAFFGVDVIRDLLHQPRDGEERDDAVRRPLPYLTWSPALDGSFPIAVLTTFDFPVAVGFFAAALGV